MKEPGTSMTVSNVPAVTRRRVLGSSVVLGVGLPWSGLGAPTADAADDQGRTNRASVRAAVHFLQHATDAYRSSGFRLVQSYQDDFLTDISFIYDSALTSIALLSIGDVARARAIGDALLYAQTHDVEFKDFRLRQGYHADGFVDSSGVAVSGYQFALTGTAVGDMAWSGIALAQLAHETKDPAYLEGATRIATWIHANTYSTTGLGGYTFGETAGLEAHKSAEHNLDVYAFFRMVASLTRGKIWSDRADHALAFVASVWNADDGFFWAGSDDGSTINKLAIKLPEDVQTWSWLAVRDSKYRSALDWAAHNLATIDTPLRANSSLTGNQSVSGVAFGSGSLITDTKAKIGGQSYNPNPDDAAVWFEGTAHLAAALRNRGRGDDRDASNRLLSQIRWAQEHLGQGQKFGGIPVPGGVVASSSPLDTGFGFGYFPNLHVGATSWYVFAATGFNPYRFPH
jgi:hypothetical protein